MSKRAEIHTRNLVLAVLLMVSIGASAETLTGMVVGVADGDTITVLDANREQHKIRVAGIDAPEKAQPFGQRSKESLSAMVFGKEVDVHWHKQDRYGRIVGKVMVAAPSCRASQCLSSRVSLNALGGGTSTATGSLLASHCTSHSTV